MEFDIPFSMVLLLVGIAAILGAIAASFVAYSYMLKKQRITFDLDPSGITNELISLKSSMRLVFLVGPLLAFILSVVGIKGWEDAKKIAPQELIDNAVKKLGETEKQSAKEINKLKENIIQAESIIARLNNISRDLVYENDLDSFFNKAEIEDRYTRNSEFESLQRQLTNIKRQVDGKLEISKFNQSFNNLDKSFISLSKFKDKIGKLVTEDDHASDLSTLNKDHIKEFVSATVFQNEIRKFKREHNTFLNETLLTFVTQTRLGQIELKYANQLQNYATIVYVDNEILKKTTSVQELTVKINDLTSKYVVAHPDN